MNMTKMTTMPVVARGVNQWTDKRRKCLQRARGSAAGFPPGSGLGTGRPRKGATHPLAPRCPFSVSCSTRDARFNAPAPAVAPRSVFNFSRQCRLNTRGRSLASSRTWAARIVPNPKIAANASRATTPTAAPRGKYFPCNSLTGGESTNFQSIASATGTSISRPK